MNIIETLEKEMLAARERPDTDVRPGDVVKVYVRIQEGDKTRVQAYEGTVTRIKKGGIRATFTVRKISSGVGVERIFPASSPNLTKIEVLARHKVRRAKLNYLRSLKGKAARLKPLDQRAASAAANSRKK
jgi:large subunit ribosomal protein L19